MAITNKVKEIQQIKELEFKDKYVFNKDTKQYIVFLKSLSKSIVVDESIHKAMLTAYSGEDERSISEICATFNFPETLFTEYKTIFGWNRKGLAVTDEEIEYGKVDTIVEDLVQQKRFEIAQKLQKKDWDITQQDAIHWREFEIKVLNPFENAIKAIKPLPVPKIKPGKVTGDKHLVIGLSDNHFGSVTDGKFLFNAKNKGWTMADTNKAIDNYATQLNNLVKSRNYKFKEALIFSLGDQIHQNYDGKTTKGTVIEGWPHAEEQWENAFNSYSKLIGYISDILPVSRVISVAGNHSSFGDTILFKALQGYFRNNKSIKFEVYDSRWCLVKVGKVGIIAEHGASPYYKSRLPRGGTPREAYIQKLMWEKREELKDCSQILFISGDTHSFQHNEYGQFDQIIFGSLVGADKYADNNNLRGKPRQNALVLENGHLSEVLNFYLD